MSKYSHLDTLKRFIESSLSSEDLKTKQQLQSDIKDLEINIKVLEPNYKVAHEILTKIEQEKITKIRQDMLRKQTEKTTTASSSSSVLPVASSSSAIPVASSSALPSVHVATALYATIASIARKRESDIERKYNAKSTEELIKLTKKMDKHNLKLSQLNDKVAHEKEVYKKKYYQDPDPTNKKTLYGKAILAYKELKAEIDSEILDRGVIEKLISQKLNIQPPEQNPEIPTSSMDIKEEVETVVGTSGLTREQLERISEPELTKGKERLEDIKKRVKPEALKMDILNQIPREERTKEVESELDALEGLGLEKLSDTYDQYKQELERRGIQEQYTQTTTTETQMEIDQANLLISKFPTLKNSIITALLTDLSKKGITQKELSSVQSLYNLDYSPVSFSLYPIDATAKKRKDIERFVDIIPNSYGYRVEF